MKYITNIRKSFQGAWVISGIIGTKQYMYYSKKEAIKLYNQETKKLLNKENKNYEN